jgi:transcriptional regulator with XRE-family HTH domain
MDRMAGIRQRIRKVVNLRNTSQRALSIKAGLAKGHVTSILDEKLQTITIETLEKIAKAADVPFEYLAVGLDSPEAVEKLGKDAELVAHDSPSFAPAARAFLELEEYSEDCVAVVRAMRVAPYNRRHKWTAHEWFDELRAEHRRRSHQLKLRSG